MIGGDDLSECPMKLCHRLTWIAALSIGGILHVFRRKAREHMACDIIYFKYDVIIIKQ